MEDKLLRFIPKFYAKADPDSALRHLTDALVNRLTAVEQDLIRISMSHYVDFASSDVLTPTVKEDLDRIGSLYNIARIIERVEPTPQMDVGDVLEAHRKFLERYRQRLKATIQIFIGGLATSQAIVRTVAAVFGLQTREIVPPGTTRQVPVGDINVNGNINIEINNDEDTTTAVMVRPGRQEAPFLLEIIDNPLRQRLRSVVDQEASLPFTIHHRGLMGSHPQITIITGGDPDLQIGAFGADRFGQSHFNVEVPIAFPVLLNTTLGQMIFFNATIPSGQKLEINFRENRFKARLTDADVDVSAKLFFAVGAWLGYSRFGAGRSRFGAAVGNPRHPDLPPGEFGSSVFNAAVFPAPDPGRLLAPFLRPGENRWRYGRLKSAFVPGQFGTNLADLVEFNPQVLPRDISFLWEERARAAFKVRLPSSIGFLVSDRERKLFIETVHQVKAVGVEPIFDFQNIFSERHDDVRADVRSTDLRPSAYREEQAQTDTMSINGLFGRTAFNRSVFGA
jgi:hypothetical protein